jgi:hypothetical protein
MEVESWVIKHVGELGILEGWIDVVSMLELLSHSGKSSDAQMEGQAKAKKAGFDSQEEGRLVNSFLTVIPSVFNPSSNKKELFPAIAKFQDFDCDDRLSGFVNSLDEAINIWEQQQTNSIEIFFPEDNRPAANLLAVGFQQKSVMFWRKFTSWVSKFYNRLTLAASKVPRGTTIGEIREQDESLKSI